MHPVNKNNTDSLTLLFNVARDDLNKVNSSNNADGFTLLFDVANRDHEVNPSNNADGFTLLFDVANRDHEVNPSNNTKDRPALLFNVARGELNKANMGSNKRKLPPVPRFDPNEGAVHKKPRTTNARDEHNFTHFASKGPITTDENSKKSALAQLVQKKDNVFNLKTAVPPPPHRP